MAAAAAHDSDGRVTARSASLAAGRTVLFVDDHEILYRSGTRRILYPLQRHAKNPLIRQDKPWEVAIAWCTVHRDEGQGIYQLWYQAFAASAARKKTHGCVVCYAESKDGIMWEKRLGLHQFNDVQDTNVVLLANGGTSDRYCASVLHDPRDAHPSRRYKMGYFDYSIAENGEEYPGLSVAFSPDGIHWTKHPKAPLQRIAYGAPDDPPLAGPDTPPWLIPLSMADARRLLRSRTRRDVQ